MRASWIAGAAALAVTTTAVAAVGTHFPRSTDGSDPSRWDPRSDSLRAGSANHKLLYENARVRVISVTMPVGSTEPYHAHPYCSALVIDTPGRLSDRDAKGKETTYKFNAEIRIPGEAAGPPLVVLQPPQALHSIRNLDTFPMHLTRIEFKNRKPDCSLK